MIEKEKYIKIINNLLVSIGTKSNAIDLSKLFFTVVTLIENLYGKGDVRISDLVQNKAKNFDPHTFSASACNSFHQNLKGILLSIKHDVENDLIFNVEKQAIGSVVADFITLAKTSSEKNNKDVAAVLASAALEDSLKRYALLNNLNVDDKEMPGVISALKGKGLLKGPQASVVSSHTKTRNKAFHAQFDSIEMPEVKSLIAFTEEFIIKNLS